MSTATMARENGRDHSRDRSDQLDWYKDLFDQHQQESMDLLEYLGHCKTDPTMYASSHERLLKAIGDPVLLDTSGDERLSRIFSNRVIRTYPSFAEFYGMEDTIDHIVSFLRHGAQGLEELKQVLYLLGPVGGGKSSLAERIKELMEQEPFTPFWTPPSTSLRSACSPTSFSAKHSRTSTIFRPASFPGSCLPGQRSV